MHAGGNLWTIIGIVVLGIAAIVLVLQRSTSVREGTKPSASRLPATLPDHGAAPLGLRVQAVPCAVLDPQVRLAVRSPVARARHVP